VATVADLSGQSGAQDIYRANTKELVRKLNPLGVNILPKTNMNWFQNAAFTDIAVDADGVMTMCDAVLGMIYQCDKNGRLMFAFGGIGGSLGLFKSPSSVISVGGRIWVLDSGKRNITIFELTEFGASVHEAMKLYNEGRYQEDISLWEEVARADANYLLAYTGLGKAYFQLENYSLAMERFRMAGDRAGYSEAFAERSLEAMRENIGWLFMGLAAFLALAFAYPSLRRRVRAKSAFFKEAGFCLHCSANPVDGFDAVKWNGKGSVAAGLCLVFLLFLSTVFKAQLTGFIFNTQNPDKFSAISVFAVTVGGFAAACLANYAVSSMLPSEATARQLFITLSYALLPYIICAFLSVAASNLISAQMGIFLNFLNIAGIGWSAAVLAMGMYQTHRLSFPLVLANLALTAAGMVVEVFLLLLLYSLFQQIYAFFFTIFSEIMFRI
jgi:tetratricopeptide (TPR) repeat protein